MAFAWRCGADASDAALDRAYDACLRPRPTAVNLRWALDEMRAHCATARAASACAQLTPRRRNLRRGCRDQSKPSASTGCAMLREPRRKKKNGGRLNVLTHCNAGWLATVDWGTALAPIYKAHDAGLPIHVWVDETRPRNQGMSLTAWELGQHGVKHTVDRRQCRRPSDAARHGRSRASSAPTAPPPTAMSATRSAPI